MRYQKEETQIYEFYSSIEQRAVEWLWYPYIPYGKITVLQGDPGDGKSTFALNIAALLTQGKAMPDGFKGTGPQVVMYQCAEDNPADTIKPRLLAAGADCDKVVYIVNQDEPLNLDDDRIEQTIRETSARLCILDPLQSFLVQDGDMHSVVRMRNHLSKIGRIAAEYGCAIVLVSHMNKSTSGKMLYRSLGSIDIAAIARSVLLISRDEEDLHMRYMSQVKSSLAPAGAPIGFVIGSDGIVKWCAERNKRVPKKKENCEFMLLELLEQGPLSSAEVTKYFEQNGISERTLAIAKKNVGVRSVRRNKVWFWYLPDEQEMGEAHESDV